MGLKYKQVVVKADNLRSEILLDTLWHFLDVPWADSKATVGGSERYELDLYNVLGLVCTYYTSLPQKKALGY